MTNPFLSRYHEGNLILKTNTRNLFWVLVLLVSTSLSVLGLSAVDPGISGAFVPLILAAFALVSLSALLLLTLGQYQGASWITFAALLGVMAAVSLLTRTGATEMDVSQATVFFFLGLLLLQAVGVGGILTGVWVAVGAVVLVFIALVPSAESMPGLTVAQWNSQFTPWVSVVLYGAGGLAGALLLVQGRRNLKMMQWDQEIIETTNQMLEETVEDRTRALRTILDSSGQGLFTIGADFTVEPDYSHGCRTIFGRDIGGLEADRLLFPQGSDLARDFRQGLGLYFAGKSKASVIFDLLEKETFVRGRFLTVDYREAGTGKVLVVLTDVTLDRQLADRNRADEARRTLVLKAVGHKRFFAGLLTEAEALFAELRTYEARPATEAEARNLLTALHTFKGNCGFFGFSSTQEVAHDFEYAISDSLVLGDGLEYHDLSLDLKKSYYQELNVIIDALGRDWLEEAGGIVIPREVFDKVAKYVGRKFAEETHLVDVLEHFRKMPLKDLFSRFPFVAQATAERLGKKIAPMEIVGGDIRVVPDRIEGLVSACVHIVNNQVDHGIELSYVREAAGKPSEGRLKLSIVREDNTVVLTFSDDGAGVDVAAVETRAKALGLVAPTHFLTPPEVLQLLFAPGFTTRDEATEVSGRGIGLGAVKLEAERLGGRISAHSKPGRGTTFEIILPLGVFANRRFRGPAPGRERRKV